MTSQWGGTDVKYEEPKRTDQDRFWAAMASLVTVMVITALMCAPAIIWAVWGALL